MSSNDEEYDEFEIDGVGFRLKALPSLVAEALAPALTAMMTPAIAAFFAGQRDAAQLGQALQGLTGSAEQLPKLRAAFAARTKVTVGKVESEVVWTELKGPVFDATFRRKHKLYFEWIGKCLALEYGDFLAEIGQALARSAKTGNLSDYLSGSPGDTGESPPTPE